MIGASEQDGEKCRQGWRCGPMGRGKAEVVVEEGGRLTLEVERTEDGICKLCACKACQTGCALVGWLAVRVLRPSNS